MSDATGENDSVKSIPGTCVYPLTTFLNFRLINTSDYFLLLNTHLTGTGFMSLSFTKLLFVGIQAFLYREFFTSDIAGIFNKYPFGLVVFSLRVSGYPVSVEIYVLHAYWISSS